MKCICMLTLNDLNFSKSEFNFSHESKSGDDSTTSSCSVHTALEFVDLLAFKNKTTSERITREELRTAIVANKMRYTDSSKEEAEIYAKVVMIRIMNSF